SSALSCLSVIPCLAVPLAPPPFPTRRSSDLAARFPASRWSWGRCQSRQFSFTKRWVVLPSGAPRCHTHESAGPRGRALRRSSTGQRCWPTPISQFIHATPAPARTAPPRETSTPPRPLDAAAQLPVLDETAQMVADALSIITEITRANISSAPTTSRRSPMPASPSKSGNTSMTHPLLHRDVEVVIVPTGHVAGVVHPAAAIGTPAFGVA